MRISLLALVATATSTDYIEDPFDGLDWASSAIDHSSDPLFDDFDWDYGEEYDDATDKIPLSDGDGADLDINPEGACKSDIAQHPECQYSKKDKAVCLWMSNVDNYQYSMYRPISPECKQELIEFLTDASEHPFAYFHDLKTECDSDLKNFCDISNMQTTALACLRANMDQITHPSCRDEIVHLNSWTSLNETWWSPSLWKDCTDERRSVCSNFTSNGLSDFRDCLDDHRFDLTDQCRQSLFKSDLQAAPNPYLLRRDLQKKCRTESKFFCSDVSSFVDENQLFCLYRASKRTTGGLEFGAACAEAVQSVITIMESDYRLNGPIRKFCHSTINQFCLDEKRENDKQHHEDDGVLTCLKRVYLFNEHRQRSPIYYPGGASFIGSTETDACMRAVRQSVVLSSLDWEVDSSLHANCFGDYHRLQHRLAKNDTSLRDIDSCAGETPHQCLQSHFHDITDPECQKAVALHSQLESLDQDFKPQLLRACALAIDAIDCSEFKETADHHVGKDGLVQCLYEKVELIHDPHCRSAIRHDYQLSERDFHLSYTLSLTCAKDRVRLCKNFTSSEVLKCMVDHVDEITDIECQKDVSRLSFVAFSEGEDLLEKSVCAGDVEKFCSTISTGAHGSIHSCLLNHLTELSSEKCREKMLNLHSSKAAIAAVETVLNSVCSEPLISDECRSIATTSGRLNDKVECIERVKRGGLVISNACKDQLVAAQSLLTADYRTNPEIQKDCKMDVASLCPDAGSTTTNIPVIPTTAILENTKIMCLVTNRIKIRNSNCKHHIVSTIYRMSDNVQFVPGMRSVCGDDITRHCSTVDAGNGHLHECLRDHFDELSHDCQAQEFVIEQLEEISMVTENACDFELQNVCEKSSSLPGGKLHCLWRNIDEVSQNCRTQVRREMNGKIGNIWLDPLMYTRCRSTVNSFLKNDSLRDKCPSHLVELQPPQNGLIPLPTNYTQAVNGEHVYCLGSNRAKIQDQECLRSVERVIQDEMKDPVLLKFGLKSQCKRDLALGGVCGESDPFDTVGQWRCLQENLRASTSSVPNPISPRMSFTCTDGVKRVLRMSSIDVKFNPDISTNCQTELTHYCKDSSTGSRAMPCLMAKYNESLSLTLDDLIADRPDDIRAIFSEECAEAMKRLPDMQSLDLGKTWKRLVKQPRRSDDDNSGKDLPDFETMRLLKEEDGSVAVVDSGISLSGPLAFVSLASLFVVIGAAIYRVFKWRMNKGYMVIVEKE